MICRWIALSVDLQPTEYTLPLRRREKLLLIRFPNSDSQKNLPKFGKIEKKNFFFQKVQIRGAICLVYSLKCISLTLGKCHGEPEL
jgi:hypothetical protein